MTDSEPRGRCGNCMAPYRHHIKRMEAAPICATGGVYRPATEAELEAGYKAAFPYPPQPIATFDLNDPAEVERARSLLNPAALDRAFGSGGRGVQALIEQMGGPA